ncbi:brain-specific serine protease 4-like [Littorina saxatilis]|uniref:brain-specific serine protease 4-like n=1 Tax=Littorina saxatilis TaxID=31220 RepID=UPI0038B5E2C0
MNGGQASWFILLFLMTRSPVLLCYPDREQQQPRISATERQQYRHELGDHDSTADSRWRSRLATVSVSLVRQAMHVLPVDFTTGHCRGVVVNHRLILTVAHCFFLSHRDKGNLQIDSHSIKVRIGPMQFKSLTSDEMFTNLLAAVSKEPVYKLHRQRWGLDNFTFDVDDVIIHPRYQSNLKIQGVHNNDIALLRLYEDLPLQEDGMAVLQHDANHGFPSEQHNCFVFARDCEPSGGKSQIPSASVVHKVEMRILPEFKCYSIFTNTTHVSDKVCAAYRQRKRGLCKGDSGGPLVCRQGHQWVISGLTSLGHVVQNNHQSTAVFTRVAYFMTWIQRHVKCP